ncbi:hypothetical protein D3C77_736300 [compost metagenome]
MTDQALFGAVAVRFAYSEPAPVPIWSFGFARLCCRIALTMADVMSWSPACGVPMAPTAGTAGRSVSVVPV